MNLKAGTVNGPDARKIRTVRHILAYLFPPRATEGDPGDGRVLEVLPVVDVDVPTAKDFKATRGSRPELLQRNDPTVLSILDDRRRLDVDLLLGGVHPDEVIAQGPVSARRSTASTESASRC